MPFTYEKTLANGVTGEYWRITRVCVSVVKNFIELEVSLYVDEAAFLSGKVPLEAHTFTAKATDVLPLTEAMQIDPTKTFGEVLTACEAFVIAQMGIEI